LEKDGERNTTGLHRKPVKQTRQAKREVMRG